MFRTIYLLALLLVLTHCGTPAYLSESKLHAYVQDAENGLTRSRKVGNLNIAMSYRPNDFLIWQEVEGNADTKNVERVQEKYADYCYFTMQLASGDRDALYGRSESQGQFSELLQTLSFRMDQYINMTTSNQDTIPLADFYYSRTFGLSKSNNVLLVFNREKLKDTDQLSINMKEFGLKSGNQSFRFGTEKIENAPKLSELQFLMP